MENKELKIISVDAIIPNKYQPRTRFEKDTIVELAQSIQENGLIQPLVVRAISDDQYELVAGERRYRAAYIAGFKEVPCIVQDYSEQQSAEIAIIENIQREDLTAIEEAIAYEKLMQSHNYTQSQLATKVGKKQSTIANKLRLLNLPDNIQTKVRERSISERHARALLSLRNEKKMNDVMEQIISKDLTVKQTEDLVQSKIKPLNKANRGITQNVKIAINTINQAVEMVKKTGSVVEKEEIEKEDEYVITIRIKKWKGE